MSSRIDEGKMEEGKANQAVDDVSMRKGPKDTGKEEDDGRGYVVKYSSQASYPFEVNETVWIVKPGYRAALGPFRIIKAHAENKFELVKVSDGTTHSELVDGAYLRRDI